MTKARVNADNASADIQGVTAGTGLSGGGTSGTVTLDVNTAVIQARVANVTDTEIGYLDGVTSAVQTQLDAKIANTLTTTTGDIIYASAANTPARRGIGSTGQVLSVSGGVPTWTTLAGAEGGFALLSSTGLSGGTTTISSIPSNERLFLMVQGAQSSTGSVVLQIRFNGDTAGNYSYGNNILTGASSWAATNILGNGNNGDTSFETGRGATASSYIDLGLQINGCKSTSGKTVNYTGGGASSGSNNQRSYNGTGVYKGSAAITSISIICSGGTWSGGTAFLYGSAN
jgi:hypothetical protein